MQGGEERRLGAFLIDRAAADDNLAEARLVDQLGFERRRRPLGRIELFDVVHEVEADGLLRASIERGEDAGLAFGLDHRGLLETGVARELGHVLRAFFRVAVFRGDRRQRDPVLQALERFVVALDDFGIDRLAIGGIERLCGARGEQHRARSNRSGQRTFFERRKYTAHIPSTLLVLTNVAADITSSCGLRIFAQRLQALREDTKAAR